MCMMEKWNGTPRHLHRLHTLLWYDTHKHINCCDINIVNVLFLLVDLPMRDAVAVAVCYYDDDDDDVYFFFFFTFSAIAWTLPLSNRYQLSKWDFSSMGYAHGYRPQSNERPNEFIFLRVCFFTVFSCPLFYLMNWLLHTKLCHIK